MSEPQLSAGDIEALAHIGRPKPAEIDPRYAWKDRRIFCVYRKPGRHRIKARPAWFNPNA